MNELQNINVYHAEILFAKPVHFRLVKKILVIMKKKKVWGVVSSDCRGVKKSKKRNLDESESEVLLVEKNKNQKTLLGYFNNPNRTVTARSVPVQSNYAKVGNKNIWLNTRQAIGFLTRNKGNLL